jgi:phage recombination protein Bet
MNAIVKSEHNPMQLASSVLGRGELVKVLQSSLYPGASTGSVELVLDYCIASKLDPMQKPVHIVPMWNAKAGQMTDVVMPGVNLYRTQAMRSGECAGVSEPEYGPDKEENIGGVTITYPQWCKVVIKRRMKTGEIVEFTAKEFWKENYAIKGGKEKSIAPNAMWMKRPYGQIAKCAEAQALRKAFPEIASQPTADEMEGKPLLVVDADPVPTFDYVDPSMFMDMVNDCKTDAEALKLWKTHNGKLAKQPADHAAFKEAVTARRIQLKAASAPVDVGSSTVSKTFEEVMTMLFKSKNIDQLYVAGDWIGDVNDPEERRILGAKFDEIKNSMES